MSDFAMGGDAPIVEMADCGCGRHQTEFLHVSTLALASPLRATSTRANVRGGPVVDHLQRFADAVQAEAGVTSFGTYNGHSPDREHAIDIFVAAARYDSDPTLGNKVAQFAIENMVKFGLDYVIWRQQIFNPEILLGWRSQRRIGDPTADHFDHVHISANRTAPQFEEELSMADVEAILAELRNLNGKMDELLVKNEFANQVLSEVKREQSELWGQPNWHLTGEAGNTVIGVLLNMVADIKKAVVQE